MMQPHVAAQRNKRGIAAGGDLPCPLAGALVRLAKNAVFFMNPYYGRCALVDLRRCIHDLKDTFCTGERRENGVNLL